MGPCCTQPPQPVACLLLWFHALPLLSESVSSSADGLAVALIISLAICGQIGAHMGVFAALCCLLPCSPILHHGHGTAHHRAVGSSSSSTSSSRPGTAVSISQAATAVSAHRKSFSSVARTGVNGSSSSSAGRKEPKQLLLQADDPAAEASPLLTPPGAHSPASAPADKLAPGRPVGAPGGGPGAAGGSAGHLAMRSLATSQMLASLDFWLLFVQFTVASGVCLAYLNNLVSAAVPARSRCISMSRVQQAALFCDLQQRNSGFMSWRLPRAHNSSVHPK